MRQFKIAEERYNSLKIRQFKKVIKKFLFDKVLRKLPLDEENIQKDNFKYFSESLFYDKTFYEKINFHSHRYSLLWQDETGNYHNINEIFLSETEREKYEIKEYQYELSIYEILNTYNDFRKKHNDFEKKPEELWNIFEKTISEVYKMNVDDFKNWFGADDVERKCHYCGISESDIQELLNGFSINKNFLFYPRGERMEVDRIDSFKGYEKKNIELCCYWCNNAKTDEFNYDEFKDIIAPAIQKIWENRLEKKLIPPPKRKI